MGDNFDLGKVLEHSIMGWIDGPGSRPVKVDKWTRALLVIDPKEHFVHRGYSFLATASTLVNTGGKLQVRMDTNYSRPEFGFEITVSTAGIFRTWLPSTSVFAAANESYILNRNFKAGIDGITSAISLCSAPASADTDAPVRKIHLGSAAGPGGMEMSGGVFKTSLMFYINQTVLFELEATTDDCALTMFFNWNEHAPYEVPGISVPV